MSANQGSPLVMDNEEVLTKMTMDLREAAKMLTSREARYIIDIYYGIQKFRKQAGSQTLAMGESAEPHRVLDWVFSNSEKIENGIKKAMDSYSDNHVVGVWAKTQVGIGPVISGGLLAHINMKDCLYPARIWRFAGQDPTMKWLGKEAAEKLVKEFIKENGFGPGPWLPETTEFIVGTLAARSARQAPNLFNSAMKLSVPFEQVGKVSGEVNQESLIKALSKRPWNARLKTLCWNIGECFVKVSGNPNAFYGDLYRQRKLSEVQWNEEGRNAEWAKMVLETRRIGKGTDAYKAYSQGKLPPAHVHARAKRWVVKLFLAHWHTVAWESTMGTPAAKPYVFTHETRNKEGLIVGHADIIAPPNWPMV